MHVASRKIYPKCDWLPQEKKLPLENKGTIKLEYQEYLTSTTKGWHL